MSRLLRARAFRGDYGARLRLYLFVEGPNEKRSFVESMQLVDVPEGDLPPEPPSLDVQGAQQLMDDLWSAGIRPTDAKDPKGQIQATERHLQDMRALAFAKLNVEAPK